MYDFFKWSMVFLLCCGFANAQNDGKITGKVQTPDGKPAESITITLLLADNSIAKIEATQADGSFELSNLEDNTYQVAIDHPGYKTFTSHPILISQQTVALDPIVLEKEQANTLNEVSVVGKKAFVEYKMDKTIVNVDAMLSNAGTDAMEVLEKSPGIVVDQNGTITFKGKSGVMVFIDDKPTYLSGAELEAYLKSLPASTLSQIEFMTNPPAKYEAAGSAGVINIKTKRSKSKGFNGSATSRLSQGKRTHTRNGLNLNYKNDKIRLYGNAGYATQEFLTDLYIFRDYKNDDGSTKSLFHQNTMIDNTVNTGNAKIGMDYYASEKTTWGISLSGLTKTGTDKSDGSSRLTNAASVLDSTIIADNKEKKKFRNGGVNLNYSHEFDSIGKKFSADVDFLTYSDDTDQRYRNYIYQPDNTLSSSDESTGKLPSKINIYAFKMDYSNPLKKEALFETGYKISYSKTDNVAAYDDIFGGIAVPNYESSNHFKYDEMINAVYVNFNKSFGKFSFQSGLRLENTVSKGNQLGNFVKSASVFKKDYTNLFPTLYAMYKLDSLGSNQLVFSYGRRINRPYFQDLNPFLSPLDKFTFYSGNPYLNPSFAHNFELSYRHKSLFSTTLSYNDTKDNIDETIEINNGIYYSRPGNIGKSQTLSLNVESEFDVTKWYSANVYSEVTNLRYKSQLYTEELNISGTFFFILLNNKFKLSPTWSAELFGRYLSKVESGQVTTDPKGTVNVTIQKKILGNKGSLKLSVNDIFYTSINSGVINNLRNTYADYENRGDTRYAALTFTYGFGKSFESKNSQERTSAESEQNRVKN
ncbi:MAG TPA: outer membrane beta-barrel protein [Flavobacterium sp.]|nr:outer membrane beta-barrel protein [Flavobacterium sp.]